MSNEQQPKNKGGRPKFEVTPEMRNNVELLSGACLSYDKIAIVVGCSEKTLRTKFKRELSRGSAKLEALCVGTQIKALSAGGTAALRASEFLLHTRFGWSRYAPPPVQKVPELGKKEQREVSAHTGFEGTRWADIVNMREQ
ncbi:MAG: hypothetical protein ABJA10_07665 [Aestuariivirga sp.]